MSKKKKAKILKRRAQAKYWEKRKSKSNSKVQKKNVQILERSAISETNVPDGFRAVSMSNAIMEYAKPVMKFVERGIVKDPNDASQIILPLWNFLIEQDQKNPEKIKKDIIKTIGKTLQLNLQESTEFLEYMVQRKDYLLPSEIQPDQRMTMYIRKEKHFLIPEFDYRSFNISDEPVVSDSEDNELIDMINKMDKYIEDEIEYNEREDHYLLMEKKSNDRFNKWLVDKGVIKYSKEFPFYVEIYLNFIYRYNHDDKITLRSVLPIYIEEFFVDHILRKLFVEPYEYIMCSPALKLFYYFLYEKGYLKNHKHIIKLFNDIEPHFITILRDRFS